MRCLRGIGYSPLARPVAAVDWRKALVFTHRWLGIAGGVLFVAWFASGIVMVYKRMPRLEPEERLTRLPVLDLSTVRAAPGDAARAVGLSPQRLRIGMLADRPVYRFAQGPRWSTVFADTGEPLQALSEAQARDLVRRFVPEQRATIGYDGFLTSPDQWTLQLRALLPAHRIAVDDADVTRFYVSDRTGEVVMKTTRSGRRWAYLGAVLHWLYFTPFRVHSALWLQTVIWLSIAGCVLSLSGLAWGVLRYSPAARYRLHSRSSRSPYVGLMRWHHYAGLVFGLFSFTWVLSGCLSLDPWSWHPGTAPTRGQQEAVSGGPLELDSITIPRLHEGAAALAASFPPKELEVIQFRGEPFLLAYRSTSAEPGPGSMSDCCGMLKVTMPTDRVCDGSSSVSITSATSSSASGRLVRARPLS